MHKPQNCDGEGLKKRFPLIHVDELPKVEYWEEYLADTSLVAIPKLIISKALSGDAGMMYCLGCLYQDGRPDVQIKQDEYEAMAWFVRSACGGCVNGMEMVGNGFRTGTILPRDPLAAHFWLENAQNVRNISARDPLFRLIDDLSSINITGQSEVNQHDVKGHDA